MRIDEVQTPFASRPWAAEMPSAGRPLSSAVLAGLNVARITHAAGLSSTGDPETDALLPLPERSDIPVETIRALERAGRVIAVGTSVVRALEDRFRTHGRLVPGVATSTLRIGPGTALHVVDGLLSGMHEPGESHFELFKAFASTDTLLAANREAIALGYRNHEFGDSTLLIGLVVGSRSDPRWSLGGRSWRRRVSGWGSGVRLLPDRPGTPGTRAPSEASARNPAPAG